MAAATARTGRARLNANRTAGCEACPTCPLSLLLWRMCSLASVDACLRAGDGGGSHCWRHNNGRLTSGQLELPGEMREVEEGDQVPRAYAEPR